MDSFIERALAPRRLNLNDYSDFESRALRIISISSCSASILASFIFYYTYLAIHPSRRKFRHQLIFFLITFDFLKSIAMIVFPILTYLNPLEVGQKTINFLGFFTAFSIEGGDLAILSFAVHTLLTIFYPQRTGGLYFIRYYVYVLSIVLPLLLASLAFINRVGYKALDVFCYLPESPQWYRLVLSWCPRYFIMVAVIVIYCTIYFYVINQLKKMEQSNASAGMDMKRKKSTFLTKFTPGKVIINTINKEAASREDLTTTGAKRADTTINLELQLENSQRLRTRYKVIARQIKIVFLYPIAYFLLWIFPLIQNSLQLEGQSNYGITLIVAFIQPFNGVIDCIVWLYREKPWTLTYAHTPRSPFAQEEEVPRWRRRVSFLPLFSLPKEDADATVVGTMEAKTLNMGTNALMASINPDEFLHTPTTSSFEGTVSSSVEQSYKRNMSVSEIEEEEEDEMDFMDFLNKGPPPA